MACFVQTTERFQIPPLLMLGVLKTEAGRLGSANRNTDGSIDYGPAQINSRWIETLTKHGITPSHLQWDGCVNIWVGGWILRKCLDENPGNFWRGVGCYNSSTVKPVDKNAIYAWKVYRATQRIEAALKDSQWSAPAAPEGFVTPPSLETE